MSVSVTNSNNLSLTVTVNGSTSASVTTNSSSVSVTQAVAPASISILGKGPKGDTGDTGPQGPAGIGPAGGTENQFVQKNSATDYDTKWSAYTLPAADGTDRQVLMTDGAGTVSFAYPQTIAEDVKNVSGGPLSKGTPVHVTGSVGNLAEVIAADAATNYPAHFVLDEDLADEGEGKGIALGFINNVDVPDASIYTEGQTVYLASSGGWTTTKPTGTNAIQNLGIIIKVNTGGNKVSGIVMGAGRSNDVPNIPDGQAWIGNASGVATPTTLADVATSGAYADLSGTPSIPVSGVDFDPVGTDNSTDVTLAGAYDYITIAGQTITRNQVDYNTDIANTPTIPSGDLVDDTTPQLGGALDVNGQSIVSVSNGDITLAPDGTGIVDVQGQIQASSANFPVLGFERTTAATGGSFDNITGIASAMRLRTTSTGNMTDAFGGGVVFVLNDDTLSSDTNYVARIYARRDGADTAGALQFFTGSAGNTVAMTLRADGDVGIGTAAPDEKLHVVGQIKIDDGANPYTLPAADGTANYVLQTNGSGVVGWVALPVSGVDFDPVGTDNSTDVTLAGAYNYLTLLGQQITLGQVDYTTDISNTPTIPTSGVDFDPVGTDNSTDVSINANASDVLRMAAGQVLGSEDAGADKLVFWDDSEGKLTYATIGTNLTMTADTLSASGGGGSANMSQSFTAPTSTGEFQDGARLVTDAYGTAPAATAGTLVSFGNTNVAAVGAQSTSAAATGMLTVVTDAASADELLVEGVVKMSSNTGWSTAKKGAALYMSTTAGAVTTTAPSTAGEFVRVVGHVVDATNSTIYFKPDNTWIEL